VPSVYPHLLPSTLLRTKYWGTGRAGAKDGRIGRTQKAALSANICKREKEAPGGQSRFPPSPTPARGSVIISMQARARQHKI